MKGRGKCVDKLAFVKMHGLGNDFVVVDCLGGGVFPDPSSAARRLCERRRGIGGDGLILVLPSDVADFRMRIFNADGSEAEMCGNGVRCFAKYVYEAGRTRASVISVETGAGIVRPRLLTDKGTVVGVRVDMGRPALGRESIPMVGEPGRVVGEELAAGRFVFRVTCVSMGNPHCVVFVDSARGAPVAEAGPLLEKHPSFPRRTNVEFVEVAGARQLNVRVWERGVGETPACGTGACASLVASVLNGRTGRSAGVRLPGGTLLVDWEEGGAVYLAGPAEEVFRGQIPVPFGEEADWEGEGS